LDVSQQGKHLEIRNQIVDQEKEVVKRILEVEQKYHHRMMLLWQIARVFAVICIACFVLGWVWCGVGTGVVAFVCFAVSNIYGSKSKSLTNKGVKYVDQVKEENIK
jgi:hypothetical protein